MVDEAAPVHGYRPTVVDMAELMFTGVARSIWPYLHDYFYMRTTAADRAEPSAAPAGRRRGAEVLESFLARATIANYVPRESLLLATRQPAMVPMFRLFAIHLRETRRYRPRAYPHRLTFFRATGHPVQGDDPTHGWAQLAAGGVDVHEVPGQHLTLLRQPHVRVLAEKLDACLRAASPRRG
jgi:thioesterase domain-containing protein